MQPLISVIIPVYNDEKHIERGIRCIAQQTYTNLEIIVVDDGSTDNTGMICDKCVEKDSRIKVIHKSNSGVSAARNDALDVANGEYIAFADSDDIVPPYFIEEAYYYAIKTAADVVIGATKTTRTFDGKLRRVSSPNYMEYTGTDKKKITCAFLGDRMKLREGSYLGRGVWSKLYKADLLNTIRFDTRLALSEDTLYNTVVVSNCKKIVVVDQIWYLYCIYNTSASHKFKENSIAENEIYLSLQAQTVDMSDDHIHISYIKKIQEMMRLFLFPQFFFNPQCKLSFWQKHKLFDDMRKREPWSLFIDKKYRKNLPLNIKIDSYLFEMHLYELIYYKPLLIKNFMILKRRLVVEKQSQ